MNRTERAKRIHAARRAARNLHRLQAIGHYGAGRVSDPLACSMPHLAGCPVVMTEYLFLGDQIDTLSGDEAEESEIRLAGIYLRSLRRDGFRSPVYC